MTMVEKSEHFTIPGELPVFYLLDTVICPYTVIPLSIQAEGSKAAFRDALMRDRLIVAVIKQETDPTGIGTLCRIAKQIGMPDGSIQVIMQGLERVRLGEVVQKEPFYISRITLCPDSETSDATITTLQETATKQFLRLAPSIPHLPKGIIDAMSSMETPLQAAYVITTFLPITPPQQQRVLEADTVKEKLEIITTYLTEELEKSERETQEPKKHQASHDGKKHANASEDFPQRPPILIGKDIRTNKDVTLTLKNFDLGGYFIGIKRMGKSTLMENLIMQSIKYNRGVVLIDPHGDLIDAVMNRMPQERVDRGDVILFDPKDTAFPFGLNIYHCEDKDDPLAVEYTTNLVMDLYKKLWKADYSQPMVEDIIFMTTLTIIANNMTMVEVPRLLFDDAFRSRLVRNVKNPDVLDFWKIYDNPRSIEREQGGGSIGRRIRQFTSSGVMRYIVGQSEKTLRLRDTLDQRKILLIKLHSGLPQLTSLIGSTIVSQMLQAALSRSDTDARPIVHLYCDEYSRFAVESFAQIIQEAGKYNIIPFIAHQSIGQISEENQDSAIQLGSKFVFRLIGKDAEVLANEFNLDPSNPKPTIPRNVLDYIDRHQEDVVKNFAARYIHPLQNALRKKEKRETIPDIGSYESDPYHNFGAGETSFKPDQPQEALDDIQTLLYETMRQEEIPQKELMRVIANMAPLLHYTKYYDWHYQQDTSFEKQTEAIRLEADARIAEKEQKISELVEKLNLNDYDLAWCLRGDGKKTKEEVWAELVEQAAKFYNFLAPVTSVEATIENYKDQLRKPLRKWEEEQRQKSQRQGLFQRAIKVDEKEEWIEDKQYRYNIAELRHALTSDDAFFAYIGGMWHIPTQDPAQQHTITKESIVDQCNGLRKTQEAKGTTEGIMRTYREQIQSELERLQSDLEKAKTDRDAEVAGRPQRHQRELGMAKDSYDRFVNMLKEVLEILKTPEGKIQATPTIITTQQGYQDREKQVANELTQLPRFYARVKLPHGEYVIQTISANNMDQEMHPKQPRNKEDNLRKREQIIEFTRQNDCKSRSEVEEEIRRRQGGEEPPPSITRKHPV